MTESDDKSKTLKHLQKETPSEQEITKRLAMAQLANDYEAAMLSASLLEFTIKQALISNFVPLGAERLRGLFDHSDNGPLSSFSAKIKAVYALGIVDDQMRLHFDIVRQVRNHFAHHHDKVSFDDPLVAKECNKLKDFKVLPNSTKEFRKQKLTPKLRYVQTCLMSSMSLSSYVRGIRFPVAPGTTGSGPLSVF